MGYEAEQDLIQHLDNLLSNGNKHFQSIYFQLDPIKSSTNVSFDSIEVFLDFVQTKSNIPNKSTYAICYIYGLSTFRTTEENIKTYFEFRKKSLNNLLFGKDDHARTTLMGHTTVRTNMSMAQRKRLENEEQNQTAQQSDTIEKTTNIIAQYIIFDRDVLFHFFEDDDRLASLIQEIYLPILETYYTQYASDLNELQGPNAKTWKTVQLLRQTWRGRGLKIFSDYMRSIYRLTQTIRLALGLPEKYEAPQYSIIESGVYENGFKTDSEVFFKWSENLYSKVNLQFFTTSIHDHLKRYIIEDDEIRLQVPEIETPEDSGDFEHRPALFERLRFAIRNILPLCLQTQAFIPPSKQPSSRELPGIPSKTNIKASTVSEFNLATGLPRTAKNEAPIRLLVKREVMNAIKQLLWKLKDSTSSCGTNLPTSELIYLYRGMLLLKQELTNCLNDENLHWVKTFIPEIRTLMLSNEQLFEKQTLTEIDVIFSCHESRNFEFPKKYFYPTQPSPMMKLYYRKLCHVKGFLSTWPSRQFFILYLNIVFKSFKSIYNIYVDAIPSPNRAQMLRKDLEMLAFIGRNHLELYDQMKMYKLSQKLLSLIHNLEKRIIIQFAPITLLNPLIKSLPEEIKIKRHQVHNPVPSTIEIFCNEFNVEELSRNNGDKLKQFWITKAFAESRVVDSLSPQTYHDICLDRLRQNSDKTPQRRAARMARIVLSEQGTCDHAESFDVLCTASCFDIFETDAHIIYKGLIELDQTLILPALPLIAIESVSLSKILTLLTTIEDEFDSLSFRALITAVCTTFGKRADEFVFERLLHIITVMGSYKSLKDGLLMLQSESTIASNDVIKAYHSFTQTCNEVCADFKFAQTETESDKTFDFNTAQTADCKHQSRQSHSLSPNMSQIKMPEIPTAKWEEGMETQENLPEKVLASSYLSLQDFRRFIKLRNDKDTEPCQRVLQMLKFENY